MQKTPNGYVTFPVSKPSALKVPWISKFSAHHPSIHNSRPVARLKARLALCSANRLRQQERLSFLSRAQSQHLATQSINALATSSFNRQLHASRVLRDRCDIHFWLVLPSYPAFIAAGGHAGIGGFLASSFVKDTLNLCFSLSVEVRIGWRNVVPSISTIIKSCGRS